MSCWESHGTSLGSCLDQAFGGNVQRSKQLWNSLVQQFQTSSALSFSILWETNRTKPAMCDGARWAEWFKSRYSTLMNLMNQRTNESNERLAKFQTRWSDIPQIPRLVRSALARGATWSGGESPSFVILTALQTCDDSTQNWMLKPNGLYKYVGPCVIHFWPYALFTQCPWFRDTLESSNFGCTSHYVP